MRQPLAEDVHPGHVEVLRGLQHVAIVRADLLEAMLLGAGQVEDGFAGLLEKLTRRLIS